MNRKKSVTTRIHQPPAPPLWFRTVFYLSFGAWLLLQTITEYYNSQCLHIYTHLPIFVTEKQVTAAFLNILSVGILTICLALSFIYGICTVSKLMVLSSSAFLATLLILNILAAGILMSSHFSIDMGPVARNRRVLTIYHQNVTKEHWQSELRLWAAQYPLGGTRITTAAAAGVMTTADPAPAVTTTTVTVSSASGGVTSDPSSSTLPTAAPGPIASSTASPATTAGLSLADLRQRSAWVEGRTLRLVRFFQHHAYCCGIDGPDDYQKEGAQMPPSCICRDEGHAFGKQVRPPCTARAYTLSNGTVSAVWDTGCLHLKQDLIINLNLLRDTLLSTVALQVAVVALGVILGLNMPSSLSDDDSDDEGGDY